jgi:serine protease AprX
LLAAISFALLCAGAAGARHVSEPTAKLRVPTAADRNANKLADPLERRFQSLSPGDDLSVIVSLNESATQARVESLAKAGGFAVKRRFAVIDSFAARMTRNQAETLAVNPQVRRVEANSVVRAFADGPRESFGVTKAKLDAGVDGNADGDAASYSKNDLVAAVIDTGIDTGHADLDEGKVIAFANCSGQPCTLTAPVDDNSHGTLVAATLAGSGDARADRLYQGAASGAALVGVKVLDRNGLGTKADMIAGIDWVVAHKDDYGHPRREHVDRYSRRRPQRRGLLRRQ